MPDRIFIDSNIWLYAFVEADSEKHELSAGLISSGAHDIVISNQVINEVSVNLIRKANVGEAFIRGFVRDAFSKYTVADIVLSTCVSASLLRERTSLSYWDSLIVASALENGCVKLYSEDLQDGQIIDKKLLIVNPFLKARKTRHPRTH